MSRSLQPSEKWQEFVQAEKDKADFVEDLITKLEASQTAAAELEADRDREKHTAAMLYRQYKDAENELKFERRKMEGNAFSVVLIDGDCMNFLDSLVQKKDVGGGEAAQKLRNCVLSYLDDELDLNPADCKIMIVVCCNMKGLSRACSDNNIIEKPEDFQLFIRGFNMGDPNCYFVDAGSGKECSDDKLRELFKFYVGHLQCKHILFGGSADNGYARMLGPFTENESIRDRITLLQGPPWAAELASLVPKFKTTTFPTVFRDTKIPARRVSFSTTPPTSASPKQSWASAIQTKPQELDVRPSRQPTPPVYPVNDAKIYRNEKGQRVDPPIKASTAWINFIKPKKLCNHHYLGHCPFNDCAHSHREKLSKEGMDALRVIARMTPCYKGLECDDESCFYGHRCTRND